MAASGDGQIYYRFSDVLESTLAQYEATQDNKCPERVLAWAESMIAAATIVDDHGMRNWSGRWLSPHASIPISYQLDDLQGATVLARAARLILTDDALPGTYGHRTRELKRFVQNDVVEKLLGVRRDDGNRSAFRRGPWGYGQIYSGWIILGRYDPRVQVVGEATLRALTRGTLSPSLRYMNTLYGKLSFSGHLARNRRLDGQSLNPDGPGE